MREAELIERKPSQRLIDLVNAIPELEIQNGRVIGRDVHRSILPIYVIRDGHISTRYNKDLVHYNPLRNSKKLLIANDSFQYITEESFCNLLNEHLYIIAKDKLEELLPQIQEHYPRATIERGKYGNNIHIRADIGYPTSDIIAIAYEDCDWEVHAGVGSYSLDIWEDQDKLIVKKPKAWWETQKTHYVVDLNLNYNCFEIAKCLYGITPTNYNAVGITRFKNEEEAQLMCDKLNKVIKGE